MWQDGERWHARLDDGGLGDRGSATVTAKTRRACLAALRRKAGLGALTVEVLPSLVGVAEAAAIMGWDKRRVITYLGRGSFPAPVAALASGRVWKRDDVEAYAAAWRRRRVQGPS